MRKNHLLISYSSGHPVKDTLFTMAQYVFTMNRVGKIVPPKRQILKDISLSFFPGAKIGVLGRNGAGKSTLWKIMAGVDTDRDTFRVNGCVTCAHVYRAKGNEAPMVYIANAEYCADGMELIKLRNILFTSITRSRAWVRVCGVGEKMQQIQKEYNQCVTNDYDLHFRIPTDEELKKARRLNRERTSTEKRLLETTKDNINELIDNIEKGTVDSELLPELNKLMELLKRG